MRGILKRMVVCFLGLVAGGGIGTASATIPPDNLPHLAQVKKTTPLYLQLGVEKQATAETELRLAQHWQHWSHNSHGSHYAHYSHRAHYSHYNYYR